MRFANPMLLWLLLLVPALIFGLAMRYGWRRRMAGKLGHLPQIAKLADSVSHGRRLAKAILWVAGLGLLLATMARPQGGKKTTLAPALGIDIVVALDFSKSMLARDAYPSRIKRAKLELARLIDSLNGDRLGLVAFAGETLSYPLTTDYTAAKIFWRDMSPLDMPVGGTAIGKAIVASTRLLAAVRRHNKPRSQVILLLTDGEDHQSDPLKAAKHAAKLGIRIYAVGIGSRSGEVIPQLNADGTIAGYQKGKKGAVLTTRLDAKTLQQLADLTKGKYIEMSPRRFGVEPILKELASLQRSEAKARLIRHYDDIPQWLLFPAFLLLLWEVCLPDRKRKKDRQ